MKRVLIMLVLALAVTSCRGGSSGGSGEGKLTIAVIPKGTTHVFWQMIHGGAEKAAQELGVTVIWRGPLREDDRASQISEICEARSSSRSGPRQMTVTPSSCAAFSAPP